MTASAVAMVERLRIATNAHDVDALVDCFAESYRNDTPAHPGRGFTGREQVRTNWEQIFAAVPDVTATVLGTVTDGDEIWSEWEMRGTRRDGAPHLMRGVIIFGVGDGRASWARFYLEPVDEGAEGATKAVRKIVGAVDSGVRDARPPTIVVRVTNLIMRPLLTTPVGRLVKPLALLEFTGRRTGSQRRVVVGWHGDCTAATVVTPAGWRANFEQGHPATVFHRGQRTMVAGTLDTDPARVAAAIAALLAAGSSARSLALHIPAGHVLDAADVIRTNRGVIRFERTDGPAST